jgi:pimeloyl-ACP methyl ester carboxylesterase
VFYEKQSEYQSLPLETHPVALSTKYFVGSDGVRLAADVGGNPEGRHVILLHGAGQTRHSWGNAARELADRGYWISNVDLRGHGDSDWAADRNYTIDSLCGDLRAVIATNTAKPVLIGASLGGLIALTAVGESKTALSNGLVLVDVTPKVDPEGRAKIIAFMQGRPDGFASLEEAADFIANFLPHRPRPKDQVGLHRNLRLRADGRWYWHWDPAFLDSVGADNFAESRFTTAAQHILGPTLLVRGAKSEVVKPIHVKQLQEAIPHAEHLDILDATHMIAGDRNDAFNAAVFDFLTRNSLGPKLH